ncbi:hypothetical protein CYLTODRAFT_459472 [Cylindrobasidium torrendii FP15055 ss-10]|uniref:Uncharacterized protein n=1 Tax=Cylindrobasidium torrendii FP15055 ss-10 TaxID=1314674 RepID=A0A0D7AX76_9AGAR|nr:hypothetical protein CYLTODRAFT_459472 [Cylindrobasidium torrendii FP15055 ss-10]
MPGDNEGSPSAGGVPSSPFTFSASPTVLLMPPDDSGRQTRRDGTSPSPALEEDALHSGLTSAPTHTAPTRIRRPTRGERRHLKPLQQADTEFFPGHASSSTPGAQLGIHRIFEVDDLGRSLHADTTYFAAVKPVQRRKLDSNGAFAPALSSKQPGAMQEASSPADPGVVDGWMEFENGPEAVVDPDGGWDDGEGVETQAESAQGTQRKFYASSDDPMSVFRTKVDEILDKCYELDGLNTEAVCGSCTLERAEQESMESRVRATVLAAVQSVLRLEDLPEELYSTGILSPEPTGSQSAGHLYRVLYTAYRSGPVIRGQGLPFMTWGLKFNCSMQDVYARVKEDTPT